MCVDRLEGSYVTAQPRRKLPGKSCEGARATFGAGGPFLVTWSLLTLREAGVRRQSEMGLVGLTSFHSKFVCSEGPTVLRVMPLVSSHESQPREGGPGHAPLRPATAAEL